MRYDMKDISAEWFRYVEEKAISTTRIDRNNPLLLLKRACGEVPSIVGDTRQRQSGATSYVVMVHI